MCKILSVQKKVLTLHDFSHSCENEEFGETSMMG